MSRVIFCQKLHKEAEGLPTPPFPNELGQRIFLYISKEAWQLWLKRQTMFINEYRLSLADPKARKMLTEEMERFLFTDEDEPPPGYVNPD
jgi:Fe-S cluster biosynthesis and repair protein YggX